VVELIDTHAHLESEQLAADLPAVLERARAAGVVQVVAIGTTAASSRACLDLAGMYPFVFASAGIHPNEAVTAGPADWEQVEALAGQARVVGIGETGLDRHWDTTPFALQEETFARHLDLGQRLDKPVIIHCREAEADVLRMLREAFDRHGPIRGVMHSFTGSWETAEACLGMGLFLSFAGMLTYRNAADLRAVAGRVPADRLLVETDCPYLAPMPMRGKRNEPGHVVHTARCLAEIQGIGLEQLAQVTTGNARRLFGLAP
jgi:TatD DNase family protein